MAKLIPGKGVGPLGVALTAWDVWRRIPPHHRKRLAAEARKHGPRLVKQAYTASRKTRGG